MTGENIPTPPAPPSPPIPVPTDIPTDTSTFPHSDEEKVGYWGNIGSHFSSWKDDKTSAKFWDLVKSLGAPGALLGGGLLLISKKVRSAVVWPFKTFFAHPIKSLIMGGVATIAGLALWPTLKRHGRRTLDAFGGKAPQFGTLAYNQARTIENITPLQALNKLTQEGDFTAVLTGAIGNDQNLMKQLSALQTSVEIKPMPADYRGTEQEQALYHVEKNRDNGYERKIVYIKDGADPQAVHGALLQAVHGDMFETEGVFSPIPRTSTILGFGGKKAGMSAEQLVMVSLVSQMAAYAEANGGGDPTSLFNELANGDSKHTDILKTMRVNAAVELARAKTNGTIGEGNEKVANALITNIGHSVKLDMNFSDTIPLLFSVISSNALLSVTPLKTLKFTWLVVSLSAVT